MKFPRNLLWITGIYEGVLGVPIFGGLLILNVGGPILLLALILHVITLVQCIKSGGPRHGSILGICASVFGIIPFLGWTLHVLAAVFLIISAVNSRRPSIYSPPAPPSV